MNRLMAGRRRPSGARCAGRSRDGLRRGSAHETALARRAAPAGRGASSACPADRRLHRLLRRHPPRHHGRASCSAPTTRCCPTTSGCRSATTAAPRRCCRAATPFTRPQRPAQGAGRRGAAPRAHASGSTTSSNSALFIGRGNALGAADRRWRGRGAPVRHRALQRLVRARHAGLGVPAARAVPVEELRLARCRPGS